MSKIIIARNTVNEFGGEAALEARVAAFHDAMIAHSQTENQPAPAEHPFIVSIVRGGGWSFVEIREPPASFQETPPGHRPMDPPPFLPRGVLSLLDFQTTAYAVVDYKAELERFNYITPGAGQALEYQETEREARAWKSGDPDEDYPFLMAEVQAIKDGLGMTVSLADVVTEVLTNADLWKVIGSKIKLLRRRRKLRISQLDNEDAIVKVLEESWEEIKS